MIVRRTLPAALCIVALFVAQAASAQRALVLQFEGDGRDRVRTQIIRALIKDGEVELVPIKDHLRVATRRGFKGSKLMGPPAVAATAKELKYGVALEGAVADTFFVRILDASGNELWSKELPLKRGELSEKNAGRLARALAVAARAQSGPPPVVEKQEPPAEEPPPEELAPEEPAPEEPEKPVVVETEEGAMPGLDLTGPKETPEERERRMREEERESHTATGQDAMRGDALRDEDLEGEARRRKKGAHVGPKLVRVTLGLTTTWRAYCSRPGVKSCAEFDAIPEEERPAVADTVDFSPQAPYLGFGLGLEFFPLASFDNPANGLGLSASFNRGFSRVNVRVTQGDVEQPPQTIISIDDEWHVFAHYRFYFGYGAQRDPLVAYVGAKGGVAARTFEIDPNAQVPLPGSHRRYPAVGAEASVPIVKFFRIEAAGLYLPTLSPEWSPGAGPDEQVAYGTANTPSGWMVEAGIAGDVWGPIGYSAKFRLLSFKDQFTGQGNKWNNGGVAEETYTGLFFGASAAF